MKKPIPNCPSRQGWSPLIFLALALTVLLMPMVTHGAIPDSQELTTVAPSPPENQCQP